MKKILLTVLFVLMMSMPASAMSNSEINQTINAVKADVTKTIQATSKDTISKNYPVGSIYTTLDEDLTADDLYDSFGGAWHEINASFLWASNGSGTNDFNTVGSAGGKNMYSLTAGIVLDEDSNYGFYTDGTNSYASDASIVLTGEEATFGEAMAAIAVMDTDTNNYEQTKIMPPYITVKMFENISNEFDEFEPGTLDTGYYVAKPPAGVLKSGYKAQEIDENDSQYEDGYRYTVVKE